MRTDQIELDRKTHVRFGRIGWNEAATRSGCTARPKDEVLKFNPVVLLAVACALGPEVGAAARSAAERLARHLSAVLAVHRRRPWGKPFGTGFTDAVQDLISVGLFALGPAHRRPVDEATFVESWSRLA